jgi:hypothetical protein
LNPPLRRKRQAIPDTIGERIELAAPNLALVVPLRALVAHPPHRRATFRNPNPCFNNPAISIASS